MSRVWVLTIGITVLCADSTSGMSRGLYDPAHGGNTNRATTHAYGIRDRVSTQRPANAMVCAGGLRPHSCKETSGLITRNHQVSQAGSRRLRAGKRRPTVHPAPTNGEAK
jgi:hypothetical protein